MSGIRFGYCCGSCMPALDSVKVGVMAEKYGFDSLWFPDHLVDMPGYTSGGNPWNLMATIAAQTKHIFLSTGVTDTQRCHPASIAQSVVTIDQLSHGRAGLGIGAGEAMNNVPFGTAWNEDPKERIRRLKEAVEVIKLLWGSTPEKNVSYGGKYFQLKNAWLDQLPIQRPHPPIYVGGFVSQTLKLTGELADGWYPWFVAPETYSDGREKIRRAAERVGRSLEDIDTVASIHMMVTDDPKIQEEVVDTCRIDLLSTHYIRLKRIFGLKLPPLPKKYQYLLWAGEALTQEDFVTITEIAKQIPDEIVKKHIGVGDVDECIDFIEAFIRVGARHIFIWDYMYSKGLTYVGESIKTYGNKIIPYFKEKTEK